MKNIIENILENDFVEYTKVYEIAALHGMTKKEVKKVKEKLGVQTVTLVNGEERLWLWYIPKNIWSRYLPKKLKNVEG
jgi:hypothetical protein